MAEKEIEEKMPGKLFNTYNAVLTGVLCFIAFFVCGFFARAPLGSSIGFAVIGGIVGVLVGGYRKTAPPAK